MSIFFDDSEITIERLKNIGGIKEAITATGTVQQADIQPLGDDRINLVNGRIGKTYVGFVDNSVDVKEGDQIVSSGKRYAVKAVSSFDSGGLLPHKELILIAQD